MSAAEIINELPKLSESERRAVREKLLELSAENEEVNLCNQSALEGALMLSRLYDDPAHMDRVVDHLVAHVASLRVKEGQL